MSAWTKIGFENLLGNPWLEGINLNKDGLLFKCVFDSETKLIQFEDHLLFRLIDEGLALKTVGEGCTYSEHWGIFMNTQSDLITSFKAENLDKDTSEIQHFILFAKEDIVEVITNTPPKISTLKHE